MLLSLSMASASTGTRQLVAWQALRQVWVPGDRRDHFEAIGDLRELLRTGYEKFFRPKLERSVAKMDQLLANLEADRRSGALSASALLASRNANGRTPRARPAAAVRRKSRRLFFNPSFFFITNLPKAAGP